MNAEYSLAKNLLTVNYPDIPAPWQLTPIDARKNTRP